MMSLAINFSNADWTARMNYPWPNLTQKCGHDEGTSSHNPPIPERCRCEWCFSSIILSPPKQPGAPSFAFFAKGGIPPLHTPWDFDFRRGPAVIPQEAALFVAVFDVWAPRAQTQPVCCHFPHGAAAVSANAPRG